MFSDNIKNLIKKVQNRKTLFVGLGNKRRRDDAVGLYIVENLQKFSIKNFNFLIANTTPENYLSTMTQLQPEFIIFIDAVKNKEKVGTISLLSENDISTFATSTHTSSILLIIEYLQKSFDVNIKVIGVSVKDTKLGDGISGDILESADEFVKLFN
ncbi:MAG: hydrogenase maturation protease [Candidatus Cloacimonadota bacterium]|nr:hydrogenase maturation protease [Candidatus Cloacimonadota bacterium]